VLIMIQTILIDDEVIGLDSMKHLIEKYCPELSVRAACQTPEEGIAAIENHKPQLAFLDIQMPHMSGFDLLQKVSPVSFEVIFVSAYDQYAIQAIRFSALDYLLKPVDTVDLLHAVARATERINKKNSSFQYQSVLNNIRYKGRKIERLAVPSFDGIEFLNTGDIVCCKAEGSYTSVILTNFQKKLISRNLKEFENLLAGSGFCRLHHSFLINMEHVQKYVKGDGGYVILTNNIQVDISRRRKEEFLGMLDKL
jgi:two-component system LytT family response regulator